MRTNIEDHIVLIQLVGPISVCQDHANKIKRLLSGLAYLTTFSSHVVDPASTNETTGGGNMTLRSWPTVGRWLSGCPKARSVMSESGKEVRKILPTRNTPWKTHMDPENHWLVEENNLPGGHDHGLCEFLRV